MQKTASPGLAAFMSVAMFLVAWKFAPGPDSHGMLWIVSGMFAFSGAVLMIQWLNGAERRPSPWPGWLGKILWVLRPRSWMLAWGAILLATSIYGTPHLAWEYPPRTEGGTCIYVGMAGVVSASADGGNLNGCSLVRLLRAAR